MKIFFTILALFFFTFSFGQTKEDVVDCLNLIFSQNEFQPAFSNDLTPNGAIIITADGNRRLRAEPLQKIRSTLTQDDFYNFDHAIQVVQGGTEELERLGISPLHILNFWMSGTDKQINFGLSTFLQHENTRYRWSYNMQKEGGKWRINGRHLNKNK